MLNSAEMSLFSSKADAGVCSHAYIVDGAAGVGKFDFALFCARALLCLSKHKPCGVCESCVKASSGDHPDIVVIGGDKAAAISDVRELIRRSTLKPNDGEKQVFIVRSADKLRADAQNALLKLFEEPPESVTLFLLAESRSSLLPTVLSRGQRIHLDGLSDNELISRIQAEFPSASGAALAEAVSFAQGNIGAARDYLSPESAKTRAAAAEIMALALKRDRYGLLLKLVAPKYKREQISDILRELMVLADNAAKNKYGCGGKTNSGTPDELTEYASKRALVRIGECAAVCIASLESNANVTAAASKLANDLTAAASA